MVNTKSIQQPRSWFYFFLHLIHTTNFARFQDRIHMNSEISTWEDYSGRTLLWHAVNENRGEFAHCLLEHRACVDTSDYKGASPLMLAAMYRDREMTALLNAFKSKSKQG